jgi:hypothetical protein
MASREESHVHGSRRCPSASRRSGRFPRLLTTSTVLVASAMLWTGCAGPRVIPDPNIPHQVAAETCVDIWVRREGGAMAKVKVRLLEGWWGGAPR